MTSRSPEPDREVDGGATTGDRRVREAVVSGFAWIVTAAGVIWGSIYLGLGLPAASIYPFGFAALSAANVMAYRRHRRYTVLTCIQMFAILLVPAALTLHLGGLIASGAVGIWSLLAPIGALLVIGPRFALGIYFVFVGTVVLGLWADDNVAGVETLADGPRPAFLLLNIVGVSLVAFWAMRTFIAANDRLALEQNRLRAIEKSYVAQEAMLRQQDRLATLGKLSAGVAHELNNPAAAAGRATQHLGEVVNRLVDDAIGLLRLGVGPEGLAWMWSMVDPGASTNPLDVADREEELGRWLVSRSADAPWDLANALASIGVDATVLNQASERFNERQVVGAAQWIADVARVRQLLGEVRTSMGRISEIVGALKGYSHMDGATRAPVDLVAGIEDTLVILRSQMSGITVETRFDPALPRVVGNAGELNQVWTNVLANAAEALEGRGTITVVATCEGAEVRVEVVDDGPGIAPHLIASIFDPFVTTKAPGQGTGLGLNLTHQIVTDRHGGTITAESVPGQTRFTVRLPVADAGEETVRV
ncbi:MAG TPA: sensor histidine kinase [Acidimicrobiia bacterium]|nr:sensor histidine kinase [Acidimicrobiia bacterium]